MERNQEPTEAQLEKISAVNDALIEDVMIPSFEKCCAELGITFANEEDRTAALETVAMLRLKEAQLREQGIDTNPSPFKTNRNMLKRAMESDLAAFEQGGVQKTAGAGDRLRAAVEGALSL